MAAGESSAARQPEEQELVITRIFDAPRDLVFNAWTEPAHVMRWWGPKGFTCPVCRIDLRPGGTYLSCMRSPEGKDYRGQGVYLEIVEPALRSREGLPVTPFLRAGAERGT